MRRKDLQRGKERQISHVWLHTLPSPGRAASERSPASEMRRGRAPTGTGGPHAGRVPQACGRALHTQRGTPHTGWGLLTRGPRLLLKKKKQQTGRMSSEL